MAASFKELRVWQNAVDLAMRVFELSQSFPAHERFPLTDQIRRSSRSVAANTVARKSSAKSHQ
jgi:four helix bundle protein